jgi:hypothetical protein
MPNKLKRNIAPLMGGLTILLLILAVVGWYLFNFGSESSPVIVSGTRRDAPANESVETMAEESPRETPEAVPEQDAPGTPTPGFMDDFDNGLDPVWVMLYGDPFIVNGQLTSNIGAGIAAGDASWENYQIDFDVDTSQLDCSFVDTSNSVGVRAKDFDHAYWFVFTNCSAAWSLFAGGVPDLLPDTAVNTSQEARHITMKVEETKMSAYENGSLISSIIDSRLRTGGIFLQIEARTFYDNFQVTLLP